MGMRRMQLIFLKGESLTVLPGSDICVGFCQMSELCGETEQVNGDGGVSG